MHLGVEEEQKLSEQPAQPNIIIRRATREDVTHIVRMLADDPLGSQRERYENPLPQSYYDAFQEIDQETNTELVVVELAGEVIGTLQYTLLPGLSFQGSRRAQVEAVRVDARFRSLGIGKQLMEWAIERARQQHCHVLQLTTNKSRGSRSPFLQTHRLCRFPRGYEVRALI